jgi:hypothetical protein
MPRTPLDLRPARHLVSCRALLLLSVHYLVPALPLLELQ